MEANIPTEALITTFEELNTFFDSYDRFEGWVYRGQSDYSWPLLPKIARYPVIRELFGIVDALTAHHSNAETIHAGISALRTLAEQKGETLPDDFPDSDTLLQDATGLLDRSRDVLRNELSHIELSGLVHWKRLAARYLVDRPVHELEWLALGQHFGLATRLLDWTDNPLAAAFFALFDNQHDVDAAIYAFRATPDARADVRLLDIDRVMLYRPPPIVDRIFLQHALFSVAPPPFGPLAADGESVRLACGRIPADRRELLLRKILSFGVDKSTLFPDLEGAAVHITWLVGNSPLLERKIPSFHKDIARLRAEIDHIRSRTSTHGNTAQGPRDPAA